MLRQFLLEKVGRQSQKVGYELSCRRFWITFKLTAKHRWARQHTLSESPHQTPRMHWRFQVTQLANSFINLQLVLLIMWLVKFKSTGAHSLLHTCHSSLHVHVFLQSPSHSSWVQWGGFVRAERASERAVTRSLDYAGKNLPCKIVFVSWVLQCINMALSSSFPVCRQCNLHRRILPTLSTLPYSWKSERFSMRLLSQYLPTLPPISVW